MIEVSGQLVACLLPGISNGLKVSRTGVVAESASCSANHAQCGSKRYMSAWPRRLDDTSHVIKPDECVEERRAKV
jgi:hypothetical protein